MHPDEMPENGQTTTVRESINWNDPEIKRFDEALERAIETGEKGAVSRTISDFCAHNVSGVQVLPYLLVIVRYFGYATKDDTWGEMWKRLAIMVGRRVELQTQVDALKSA